ncbi:MAG TPA: SRPBCC family protein [Povalibacter sp.]|nr:SRPBCC family protein [Povalibacter sp.]
MSQSADAAGVDERECVHSRLIGASAQRVFEAIADPVRLARWWGPKGFSSTFEEFEFRPGGRWRLVMHGPDGTDYPNESRFLQIVPSQRIVLEHFSGHHFILTITLTAQGDETRVGWQQVFDTAEHRASIAQFVLEANEQNLDRLAAEVLTQR